MTTNAGRPREYRNNAEKQKAYRERKAIAESILEYLEQQESVLRNAMDRWKKQGTVDIRQDLNRDVGIVLVNGYSRFNIEPALMMYLKAKGKLVKMPRNTAFGDYFWRLID